MESLPKLDTETANTLPHSARNSYTSSRDSYPRSVRSSYTSIADTAPSSVRTSYSSVLEPLGRVSSFSRTSDSFVPDSFSSTSVSSSDSSPKSPTRWSNKECTTMFVSWLSNNSQMLMFQAHSTNPLRNSIHITYQDRLKRWPVGSQRIRKRQGHNLCRIRCIRPVLYFVGGQ